MKPVITKRKIGKGAAAREEFTAGLGHCEATGATREEAVAAWERKMTNFFLYPAFANAYRYGDWLLVVSQAGALFEYVIANVHGRTGPYGKVSTGSTVFGADSLHNAVIEAKVALAQRLDDEGQGELVDTLRAELPYWARERFDAWKQIMRPATQVAAGGAE